MNIASASSTINIRINSSLKERGDVVLKQNGISTTAAIRMLWQEIAQTHALPDFLVRQQEEAREALRAQKLAALNRLQGIALSEDNGGKRVPSDKQLLDGVYEDMIEKYKGLQ